MRGMASPWSGSTVAIGGYLVFIAALLLTVIVSAGSIDHAALIIGLLATPLPALVAWLYIESAAWMGPELMCRIVRNAAALVATTCSFAGFFITIWTFSRLAAFVVLLQIPLWYLAISALSFLRSEET